jgi:hypothetical protein
MLPLPPDCIWFESQAKQIRYGSPMTPALRPRSEGSGIAKSKYCSRWIMTHSTLLL